MFNCCVSKKILTSAIEPSAMFQSRKVGHLETRHPQMAELLKAIEPLKKLKPNPLLNDDSTKQTNQ